MSNIYINSRFIYKGSNRNLITLSTFFILSIPLTLIIGPAISDILVSVSSLFFLYLVFKDKLYFYFNNNFFKIFFILNLYLIITSLLSDDILLSLESTLFYFRFIIFSLFVFFLIINYNKFSFNLFVIIFLILILLFFDSLFQYFSGFNIIGFAYDGGRLSSFFNEEKKLGSYVVRFTPILLTLLFITIKSKLSINILFFCILLISDIIVILSAERTAIFLKFLSNLVFLILLKDLFKIKTTYFFLILIILSSIIIIDKNIYERTIKNTYVNLFDQKNENRLLIFSLQHQLHYKSAIKMFLDNPLTGVGPKMFRVKCSEEKYYVKERINNENFKYLEGCSTHPHNNYIQLLAETGIIGFSLFIGIIIFFLRFFYIKINLYKRKKFFNNYNIIICLFVSLLISFWPFIQTGNLFNNWLNIIYYYPLGFIIYYYELI